MSRKSFLLALVFSLLSLCSTSFAQTGSISGRVTDVTDNPIENALVEAIGYTEGWGSDLTDADGNYQIVNLPAGDYRVRASAKGYAREYYDNTNFSNEATAVHVTAGLETFGVDFSLTIGGAVSGYVYQSDGISQISGAQITVKPSSTEWEDDGFHATTVSDGSFQIEGLALGEYHVHANAEDWVPEWYDDAFDLWYATDVEVIPPETTSGVNITLSKGGAISGVVYDSTGVNTIQGAILEAGGMSPYCGASGAVSMENGSYIITDLPPCGYRVSAEKPTFAPVYYNFVDNSEDADTVIVTESDTTFGIDFILKIGAAVTGHVYIYEGDTTKPISGIVVKAALPTGEPLYEFGSITDPNGSYTLCLKTGSYFIGTDAHAYGHKYIDRWYDDKDTMENADTVRVVAPDTTLDIDFYLARTGGVISGYISDATTGDLLADANIYAFPTEEWLTGGGTNSDTNGNYVIWGLAWDEYLVKTIRSGYIPKDTQITVSPDETTYVDFKLERGIYPIYPLNDTFINDNTPELVWSSTGVAVKYWLQIDDDSTLLSPVIDDSTLADTTYIPDSLPDRLYYWRVSFREMLKSWSRWTPTWKFTIDTQAPSIPELAYPANNSIINDSLLTFTWSVSTDNLSGVDHHILKYANNPDFSDATSMEIADVGIVDTIHYLTSDLPDTIYYWKVKAIDRATNESNWSDTWNFILDRQSPMFSETKVWTDTSYFGPYTVTSIVTDALSGVDSVFLHCRFNEGDWVSAPMELTDSLYQSEIPEVEEIDTTGIDYYLEAIDLATNKATDPSGAPGNYYSFMRVGIEEASSRIPSVFALYQNHPNPFFSTTTIKFALPKESQVSLKIYDMSGRLVKTLIDKEVDAGYHEVVWDSRDGNGKLLPKGVYFCQFVVQPVGEIKEFRATRKLISFR